MAYGEVPRGTAVACTRVAPVGARSTTWCAGHDTLVTVTPSPRHLPRCLPTRISREAGMSTSTVGLCGATEFEKFLVGRVRPMGPLSSWLARLREVGRLDVPDDTPPPRGDAQPRHQDLDQARGTGVLLHQGSHGSVTSSQARPLSALDQLGLRPRHTGVDPTRRPAAGHRGCAARFARPSHRWCAGVCPTTSWQRNHRPPHHRWYPDDGRQERSGPSRRLVGQRGAEGRTSAVRRGAGCLRLRHGWCWQPGEHLVTRARCAPLVGIQRATEWRRHQHGRLRLPGESLQPADGGHRTGGTGPWHRGTAIRVAVRRRHQLRRADARHDTHGNTRRAELDGQFWLVQHLRRCWRAHRASHVLHLRLRSTLERLPRQRSLDLRCGVPHGLGTIGAWFHVACRRRAHPLPVPPAWPAHGRNVRAGSTHVVACTELLQP